MNQIRITNISGGSYPMSVYVSDSSGNNETFLGSINPGPVPPIVTYNTTIPPILSTATQILLKIVDNNNCQLFKLLDCTFGCAFEITVEFVDCTLSLKLQEPS